MYATFTRTFVSGEYLHRRRWFIASSLLVPAVVIGLAVASYETYVWLLSTFFAVASLHALHQIVWLSDAYSLRARADLSWRSRVIDYAVVLTSLYPIAVRKMVSGEFKIGPVDLTYNHLIAGWYWLADLAAVAFAVALVLFVGKTYAEYRAGRLNLPKTALIAVTVLLMLWTPLFPNMDTAFQGINTWHSFQYLALTWYANRLREQTTGKRLGFLHWLGEWPRGVVRQAREAGSRVANSALHGGAPGVLRAEGNSGWASFYLLCVGLLPISGLLIVGTSLIWPNLHAGRPGADEAYTYMGILSVLLVHYAHDALLFTDSKALVANGEARPS